MTSSVLPTQNELAGITNLEEAKRWAGARDPSWTAWQTAVGQVPNRRVLANIAPSANRETLSLVRIPSTTGGDPRELSVVEAIQLALVWRVARQAFGMEDIDPLADLGQSFITWSIIGCSPFRNTCKEGQGGIGPRPIGRVRDPTIESSTAGRSISIPCRDHRCGSASRCGANWRANCCPSCEGSRSWGESLRRLQCPHTLRQEGAEADEGQIVDGV